MLPALHINANTPNPQYRHISSILNNFWGKEKSIDKGSKILWGRTVGPYSAREKPNQCGL